MKVNDWLSRFGAKRRATDRTLLAECERAIGLEESAGQQQPKPANGRSAAISEANLSRYRKMPRSPESGRLKILLTGINLRTTKQKKERNAK